MRRRLTLSAVAVLFLAVAAGFVLPDDDYFALRKSFTLFGRLYEELAIGYVDGPDPERLMRTGIDAMLASLDPYTVLLDEAATEDMEIQARGRYGGVGIAVGERAGRLVVTAVMDGSSASAQGVRPGDEVLRVEGQAATGRQAAEVLSLLRGAPDSTVELEVMREGEAAPLRFVLVRSSVRVHDVTYSGWVGAPGAGVGYVRLERFSEEAAPEVRAAIERLQGEAAANGGLRALVLDLRGNPGGLLESAVDVAGLFLPQNIPVVTMRGRAPETERAYRNRNAPLAPDLPLAVLVDGRSASASEVVAGALQDHDRAVIVGERTFGKGLVQQVRALPFHTALKLTVARYYTPSGRCIQTLQYGPDGGAAVPDSLRRAFRTAGGRPVRDGGGIEPDVAATLGDGGELGDALVRAAAFFRYANRYAATHPALPDGFAVDDAVLEDFRRWTEAEGGLDYRTRAERALDALAADLADAGYDATADEVAALRAEVDRERQADFRRHAAPLKARLRQEILARYVGQAAVLRDALADDAPLDAALAVLADARRYRRTLGG